MIGIYSGKDARIKGLHRIQPLPNSCIIGRMTDEVAKKLSQKKYNNKNKVEWVEWNQDSKTWYIHNNGHKEELFNCYLQNKVDYFVETIKIKNVEEERNILPGCFVYIQNNKIKLMPTHSCVALWTRKRSPTKGDEIELTITSLVNFKY